MSEYQAKQCDDEWIVVDSVGFSTLHGLQLDERKAQRIAAAMNSAFAEGKLRRSSEFRALLGGGHG